VPTPFLDPALAELSAAHPAIDFRERFLDSHGVRLHVVEAGPADAPPVLLLQGFPEFWWGWRKQIPALVGAGLRVVAPDLRGYNLSDKPRGLRAYGLDALTDDLIALIDDLGPGGARVAAHDWGGVVAWWAAEQFPERFDRVAILNVPHPAVLKRTLRTSREQRRRSRYMFYFQLPFLPERKISKAGYRAFRSIFRRSSAPGTFTAAELDRYAEAAARPGALTAMLNWYRAALWCPPHRRRHAVHGGPRIRVPVRLIWGTGDVALGAEMIEPSAELCERCEIFRIPTAGHWVAHEATDEVNRLLLDFLA
jgi:pimeloyl-ACP methyl ester carboxylesterase